MLNRRSLLAALAALPLCGWMKPTKHIDASGPYRVPDGYAPPIQSRQEAIQEKINALLEKIEQQCFAANEIRKRR